VLTAPEPAFNLRVRLTRRGIAMDIFVLAAIFGVAITLIALVSSLRYLDQVVGYRLRNIFRVTFPRRAANLFLVTLACLAVLFVIYVAVAPVHPREPAAYRLTEFLQSRRFGSTLLGLMFGVFLVFWIRQLLLLKDDEPLTWVHRGEAIFLVLLLVLGAFSEQIGALAQRLTQLSAAGVTLTFEALKGVGGDDRGQQGGGGTVSGHGSSAPALYFLSSMEGSGGILDRDNRYIALIDNKGAQQPTPAAPAVSGAAAPANDKDPSDAFFHETIGATAACWSAIVGATHEDQDVNSRIIDLRPTLREIYLNHSLDQPRIHAAAEKFVAAQTQLIAELSSTYLRSPGQLRAGLLPDCRPVIELRCSDARTIASGPDIATQTKPLLDALDACIKTNTDQTTALETTLQKALSDRSVADKWLFNRPYVPLLYASMLWRLEDYNAAVQVLDGWLAAHPIAPDAPDNAMRWYVIRVETTLTVIMEEWIRSGENPPPLLLIRHLTNVRDSIDRMMRLDPMGSALAAFTTKGNDVAGKDFPMPSWHKTCALDNDPAKDQKIRLATTLFQQSMVYAYRATQHPDYFTRNVGKVVARVEYLVNLNLDCINQSSVSQTDLLEAEILQIYAEVEIANAVRLADLDSDAARKRLKNAAQAAQLGSDLVEVNYADPQEEAARNRIGSDQKATELKYLLKRAKRRAEDALKK
jgi:hypothetical protein